MATQCISNDKATKRILNDMIRLSLSTEAHTQQKQRQCYPGPAKPRQCQGKHCAGLAAQICPVACCIQASCGICSDSIASPASFPHTCCLRYSLACATMAGGRGGASHTQRLLLVPPLASQSPAKLCCKGRPRPAAEQCAGAARIPAFWGLSGGPPSCASAARALLSRLFCCPNARPPQNAAVYCRAWEHDACSSTGNDVAGGRGLTMRRTVPPAEMCAIG